MFDSRCQNAGLEWARAATGSDGSRLQCPDHLCYRLSQRANASASDWWRSDLLLAKALRRRGIAWLHSASAGEVWAEERLTPTTLTAAAFVSGPERLWRWAPIHSSRWYRDNRSAPVFSGFFGGLPAPQGPLIWGRATRMTRRI